MAGRLRERQPDHDDVREAEQLVEALGLPDRLHAGLGGHVLDVHRQHAHAEAERPARDLASGAAEADDAHRQLVELALQAPDRLPQRVVGTAEGRLEAAGEAEEEGEGVLGQVDADRALLARQDHVALDQLRAEDGVHAGADRVVVTEAAIQDVHVGGDPAEEHVGVRDFPALGGRVLRLGERGAGAGRLEDAGAVAGFERRNDHNGCI